MFRWEPEGGYRWTIIMPFWLSTDDMLKYVSIFNSSGHQLDIPYPFSYCPTIISEPPPPPPSNIPLPSLPDYVPLFLACCVFPPASTLAGIAISVHYACSTVHTDCSLLTIYLVHTTVLGYIQMQGHNIASFMTPLVILHIKLTLKSPIFIQLQGVSAFIASFIIFHLFLCALFPWQPLHPFLRKIILPVDIACVSSEVLRVH